MKKRLFPVLLCLVWLFSFSAMAAGGTLSMTPAVSADGKTATVTVNFQNPGIVATRIFVRYDKAVLRLSKAENGTVFDAGTGVFGKDLTQNPYILLWDDSLRSGNVTNSGALCKLTFDIVGGTANGTTAVSVTVDDGSTFDFDLKEVAVSDATCNVKVPTKAAPATTTTKPAATTVNSTAKPTGAATTGTATTTQKLSGEATGTPAPTPGTTASAAVTTKVASTTKATVTTTKAAAPVTNAQGERVTLATSAQTTKAAAPKPTEGKPASTQKETTTAPAGSEASAASTAVDSQNADVPQTEPTAEEVFEATLYMDENVSTAQVTSIENEPESATFNRNLLWLLLLIPAAVVVVVVIQKKK